MRHEKSKLLIIAVIVWASLCATSARAMTPLKLQYEIREPGGYLSVYMINGDNPSEFKEFELFELEAPAGQDPDNLQSDNNGNVPLAGSLMRKDKSEIPFASAWLIKGKSGAYEYLKFTTQTKDGIRYRFDGRFLEKIVQERKGGSYTHLRGILAKYKNGRQVASKRLNFTIFSIE
jgi:hypothetical protein